MEAMIKAIIFDFDGVILNTAHIKEEAFKYLFPEKYTKEIMPILEKYARQSRKIIIQECIKAIGKEHDISLNYETYLEKYGQITQKEILASPEIPGATKSLNALSKKYKLFVLTATPDEQIKEIIEKRAFSQFTEVIGSNGGSKPELAKKLLEKYALNADEVVYVGDGLNDLTCAKELNMTFIGIINETNDFVERNLVNKEKDLQNLVSLIEKIKAI